MDEGQSSEQTKLLFTLLIVPRHVTIPEDRMGNLECHLTGFRDGARLFLLNSSAVHIIAQLTKKANLGQSFH